MKKFKTFVINTVILSIASLIMNIVGMGFSVYISNKIGTEALGIYQLIISIYTFAITLATSGISIAVTHLVSEKLALKEYSEVKKITKQSVVLSFFMGCFAMIILILCSEFLTTKFLHSKISPNSLILIAISLPPLAVSASVNGYFSAVTRVIKSASANFIEQFFKIIISIYFFNMILPSSLENACLSLVLGSLLSEFISFIYLMLMYKIDKKRYKEVRNKNKTYYKEIIKISCPVAITSYIRSGLSTLKQIIIPIRLEKSGISCEVALSQYGMITGMVMQYSRLNALNSKKRINNVTTKIFKLTLLFSVLIFGIFFTFADELSMAIYSKMEVAGYIKIIAPLVLIMYIDNVVDGMLKGLNKQVAVMKCNILDLFISIILMYILLPIYGIYGYIIVLFTSEILNGTISIIQLIKATNVKLDIVSILLKPLLCILLSNIAIRYLSFSYNGKVISLVYGILIYILIYIFLLFVTSTFTKKDLKL